MQLRRAIGTLAPARIGRCRCYAAQRAPPELAPAELIDSWMADSRLVSDSLGFFGRMEMHFTLRTLPGLDLPDFLQGSRLAYAAVTRLMYSRDWDALEPLVSPAMLNAMQQTMEEEPFDVRRVEGCEEEGSIVVTQATLQRVQLLTPPTDDAWAPRKCHLDVSISSLEYVAQLTNASCRTCH